ncbi:MAG: ArsR/SmtB family transcription factor [Acidimicrobiales bacterium]
MGVDLDDPAVVGRGLRAVADPLRWRILGLLAAEELCVCHLVDELGVAQSVASHHLGVLRQAGLVEAERHRYWTYYRLRPSSLAALGGAVSALAAEGGERPPRRRPCG